MNTRLYHLALALLALVILNPQFSTALAQGTAFTYQGRLNNGASPANGIYDLRFSVYDSISAGTQQGAAMTNSTLVISNGLFTATLDFGNQFQGANRWLELAVRTNGGSSFTTLAPRQPLTPTPYALYAPNAGAALTAGSANSVAAANISGTIPLAQLPASVVTNGASGVNITGNFSGSGGGLTNLAITLDSINSFGAISRAANFIAAYVLGVGSGPESIIAVDLNGDGKIDLVAANLYDNTLSVFINNGSGSFGRIDYFVGSGPYGLAAADVNGDGKVDLICANSTANTLTVLTNDGGGGFAIATSPVVGINPWSVVATDVNGDGKMDLACANYGSDTLSVLINNGSGSFVLSASLGVGSHPASIVAVDVNGDGRVDLACANLYDGTLSVLTNNGSGGFTLASTPDTSGNTSFNPWSLAAADVNGDGKVDLITGNLVGIYNTNTLSVLTNKGSGAFTLASMPNAGLGPWSVTAADVNGDGKPDLISANYGTNTLTVLTNNGAGLFVLASSPVVGHKPHAVAVADVNGDGRVDLVSANFDDNSLTVLFDPIVFNGTFAGDGSGLTGLNVAQLPSILVTNGSAGLTLAGTFTGNGAGVTNVNAAGLGGLYATNFWQLGGNNVAAGQVLGTTNNQPLELWANGKRALRLEPNATEAPNVIGGASVNFVSPGVVGATIGGGGAANYFGSTYTNSVGEDFGTIGGGDDNQILPFASFGATIGGGRNNQIQTGGREATIGGGRNNQIQADALWSTISGGNGNQIRPGAQYSAIGGGYTNAASGFASVVPGGANNVAAASHSFAAGYFAQANHQGTFVWADNTSTTPFASTADDQFLIRATGGVGIGTTSPGKPLVVQKRLLAEPAIMVGGALPGGPRIQTYGLDVDSRAWMGLGSDMGGGPYEHSLYFPVGDNNGKFSIGSYDGTTYSTKLVVGVNGNVGIGTLTPANRLTVVSGASSYGIEHTDGNIRVGTFVGGSTGGGWIGTISAHPMSLFVNGGSPSLTIATSGNVGIGISNPTNKLHVAGGVSATVFVTTSDRNAKESFQPVSPMEILDKVTALPITRWTFKEMPGQPHMGPMAQDFHTAFGLGAGDTGIATVDADGVALAAIQGLNQKLQEELNRQDVENAKFKQQNDSLAERLNELEATVKQLSTQK